MNNDVLLAYAAFMAVFAFVMNIVWCFINQKQSKEWAELMYKITEDMHGFYSDLYKGRGC